VPWYTVLSFRIYKEVKSSRSIILSVSLALVLLGISCSGVAFFSSSDCGIVVVGISPSSATADHTTVAPGNQQQFVAFGQFPTTNGCPTVTTATSLSTVTWTTSDQSNVSIGNAPGSTFGVATCINATAGPVTVTATQTGNTGVATRAGKAVTGTATLTCR
jgi:hypothetical protein